MFPYLAGRARAVQLHHEHHFVRLSVASVTMLWTTACECAGAFGPGDRAFGGVGAEESEVGARGVVGFGDFEGLEGVDDAVGGQAHLGEAAEVAGSEVGRGGRGNSKTMGE